MLPQAIASAKTYSQMSIPNKGADRASGFRESMIHDALAAGHLRVVTTTPNSIIVGVVGGTADIIGFGIQFSEIPPTFRELSPRTREMIGNIILG